jgi:hypothetical protein
MGLASKTIWVTPNSYWGTGDVPYGATPKQAGLENGEEYLVLHMEYDEKHNEWAVLLVNDRGEIWSISNRHLRVSSVYDGDNLLFKLPTFGS